MPAAPHPKSHAHPQPTAPNSRPPPPNDPDVDRAHRRALGGAAARYAELHCLSNFSFLRGASHPEELVARAAELGYAALALTDRNSLAGVVRAHVAARQHGLHLLIGAEITPVDAAPLVLLAPNRAAYGRLARLITRGRRRCPKGACEVRLDDIAELADGLIALVLPETEPGSTHRPARSARTPSGPRAALPALPAYRTIFRDRLYLAAALTYDLGDDVRLSWLAELSKSTGVPLVAANAVHYHVPERRYLQDVLTCIREQCTLATAGQRLFSNAERHLRPLDEIARRYTGFEAALARTVEIAQACTFSLDELCYEYPHELCPENRTPAQYLAELTWQGARRRYPQGIPPKVRHLLECELQLIAELKYEHYFLTVWDLVRFAQGRGILCQGRGSAANSAVCYSLGVTAVDPARIDLLFARFISRERNEPPDIDIDFEHERREEVFQYIYQKYGRERAVIAAEVITYRPRSAARDIGKALGLPLERLDLLAKSLDWWSEEAVPDEALRAAGLDPRDRTVQMLVRLVRQLLGFPRHLSQHVGGFVITETPLCEMVPVENGAMPDRTFIEWDKDDIDALGILKVDCLALGMLTAIHKCFDLVNAQEDGKTTDQNPERQRGAAAIIPNAEGPVAGTPRSVRVPIKTMGDRPPACRATDQRSVPQSDLLGALGQPKLELHTLPPEDPCVYDMICAADTVGVFQIESRAQMSMLPRLRPRHFYDLVIEVAIVRPGPIQGGMVHPYLRRRHGLEPVTYPSEEIRRVLEKTLGVPLFQEQVMRLAVIAADFTPGEADQLRRSMGAWRRSGQLEQFQLKLVKGMLANGYSREFAGQIYKQIRGFGEYGFPESHAASFALLVYASAWLKHYYPAAYCAAMLNSQPLGFYTPGQLARDALQHGVRVMPADVNYSGWDCRLEESREAGTPARGMPLASARARLGISEAGLRLGLRLIRGLSAEKVRGIEAAQRKEPIRSIRQLARRPDVSRETLLRLAAADAFRSLGLNRRQTLWQILALDDAEPPLFAKLEPQEPPVELPALSLDETVVQDYDAQGFSLKAHPLGLVREELNALKVLPSGRLKHTRNGQPVSVAGLVTVRQRPGTARGIVFMTLEDETGVANLVIHPPIWERDQRIARGKIALIAEGHVERQGEVVHVVVRRMHDLSARLVDLSHRSRDFH